MCSKPPGAMTIPLNLGLMDGLLSLKSQQQEKCHHPLTAIGEESDMDGGGSAESEEQGHTERYEHNSPLAYQSISALPANNALLCATCCLAISSFIPLPDRYAPHPPLPRCTVSYRCHPSQKAKKMHTTNSINAQNIAEHSYINHTAQHSKTLSAQRVANRGSRQPCLISPSLPPKAPSRISAT